MRSLPHAPISLRALIEREISGHRWRGHRELRSEIINAPRNRLSEERHERTRM